MHKWWEGGKGGGGALNLFLKQVNRKFTVDSNITILKVTTVKYT